MASSVPSCSKGRTPKRGFMDLSKWLIRCPKSSEGNNPPGIENNVNGSSSTTNDQITVEVEWYPIESGFYLTSKSNDEKPVWYKIGTKSENESASIDEAPENVTSQTGGFFSLGKGKYRDNLSICHSKEQMALFFNLATCKTKATFNGQQLTMMIKTVSYAEDLRATSTGEQTSTTVTCNVKLASEDTSRDFENTFRKLACVLRSSKQHVAPKIRIERIGNVMQLPLFSSKNSENDVNSIGTSNDDKQNTNCSQKFDLPDPEEKKDPEACQQEDTSMETNEDSISSLEESEILLGMFNTFSYPHSRNIQRAIELFLNGDYNGIGPNLAKDVQSLINTRQKDIEKYVTILRKTNMFKSN